MSRTSKRRGFTLIELLVVVAIIALLVSILLPSLSRAKSLAKTVVCANRHKATVTGFGYYSNDYNGVWIAPWDNENRPSWVPETHDWSTQWVYTLAIYVTGDGIPHGTTVFDNRYGVAGWYDPNGGRHTWPPTYCKDTDEAPQLQCPEMVAAGPSENLWFYEATSFSYFVMAGERDASFPSGWNYDEYFYPKPDFLTHPASTGHLMCLSGSGYESFRNAWCRFNGNPYNPHMNKSNVTFVDGHVETLATVEMKQRMWEGYWDRNDP